MTAAEAKTIKIDMNTMRFQLEDIENNYPEIYMEYAASVAKGENPNIVPPVTHAGECIWNTCMMQNGEIDMIVKNNAFLSFKLSTPIRICLFEFKRRYFDEIIEVLKDFGIYKNVDKRIGLKKLCEQLKTATPEQNKLFEEKFQEIIGLFKNNCKAEWTNVINLLNCNELAGALNLIMNSIISTPNIKEGLKEMGVYIEPVKEKDPTVEEEKPSKNTSIVVVKTPGVEEEKPEEKMEKIEPPKVKVEADTEPKAEKITPFTLDPGRSEDWGAGLDPDELRVFKIKSKLESAGASPEAIKTAIQEERVKIAQEKQKNAKDKILEDERKKMEESIAVLNMKNSINGKDPKNKNTKEKKGKKETTQTPSPASAKNNQKEQINMINDVEEFKKKWLSDAKKSTLFDHKSLDKIIGDQETALIRIVATINLVTVKLNDENYKCHYPFTIKGCTSPGNVVLTSCDEKGKTAEMIMLNGNDIVVSTADGGLIRQYKYYCPIDKTETATPKKK